MSDYLKKGFLLGLGAAVSGKEKFETRLKDLVDKNELTKSQAHTVLQNFVEKGEMKKDEWDTKQLEKTQAMAHDMGIATKEDINELRARLTQLEDKLTEQ
jgi:polyhydroxyalkanoate synthesis regulator phasin